MKETRIHNSERKGLGPLSSFSFLRNTSEAQLSDDEQELLMQINPRKHKLFSHTHLEFCGKQTTKF